MLPILISLGPVKIYSYGLLLAIGLFLGLYFWWKMGRDEHFDEIALFDGYFLSLIVFFLSGRLAYVITRSSELGTLYRALAILAYPGINAIVGILVAIVFMILFARAHDWDVWKVMDAMAVSLAMILILANMGGLLNGSNPGMELSWGLIYPGDEVARMPLDMVMLLWSVVTFGVVSRVRKNFRFYAWYKGESSMAAEGLASLVFVAMLGSYYLIAPWIDQNVWKIGFLPGQFVFGLLCIGLATMLIYKRVGRRDASLWGKLKNILRRK